MRGRVMTRDRPIPAFADDLALKYQHGADRYFVFKRGLVRQFERAPHEVDVERRIQFVVPETLERRVNRRMRNSVTSTSSKAPAL